MTITEQELDDMAGTWKFLVPQVAVPEARQFASWLLLFDKEVIEESFAHLATKVARLEGSMESGHAVRFASAVMSRLSRA